MSAEQLARAYEVKTERLVAERLAFGDRIEELEDELRRLWTMFEAERERVQRPVAPRRGWIR